MGKSNGKPEVKTHGLDVDHELPPADGDESSPASSESGAASAEPAGVDAELQKVKAERDSLLDRLARAQAEFENARRRAAKEQQDFRDFAMADAIKSLLPVVDNFERALQSKSEAADFRAGVELIYKQLRDVLTKLGDALPAKIGKFDDAQVTKISALLDGVRKANAETVPFALALVATRLKTPWHLIRLATKAAPSKNAADIAATPHAITVSMVLDRMDDSRSALRVSLRNERILVAKRILTEMYDTEYALQVRIDRLDESDWGKRLQNLMSAVSALVEAEVNRFPDEVDHVLASRSLRSHQSLAGRLTHLAWKGRDVVSDGAAYWKKLVGQ